LTFVATLAFASHTQGATSYYFQQGVSQIDGAQIHYQMTGQGQPVVLIYGYPLSSRLLRDQMQALSNRFEVITVDLRGVRSEHGAQ